MADLQQETAAAAPGCFNLYRELLGDRFHEGLAPGVRLAHTVPQRATGRFRVCRCRNMAGRLLGNLLGFPRAGEQVAVELRVTVDGEMLVWERRFDGHPLTSRQRVGSGCLLEEFGWARFAFVLVPDAEGRLHYKQTAFWFAGVKLPRLIAPRITAVVGPAEEEGNTGSEGIGERSWRVQVEIRGPLKMFLCRYEGVMHWG